MNTMKKILRINYIGKVVECGTLTFDNDKIFLKLSSQIGRKYVIENFTFFQVGQEVEDFSNLIHYEDGAYFLNAFPRKIKKKKKNRYSNKGSSYSSSITKEVKKIKEDAQKKEEEAAIKAAKLKKDILKNGKSKIKLKCDIFKGDKGLGTFADLFTDIIVPTPTEIDSNIKVEQIMYSNNNLKKVEAKKKVNTNIIENDTLVLWDTENVNFHNDISVITKLLPDNSLKVFSYSKKNHKKMIYLKGHKLDLFLHKLKKRSWIEKRTTKIADDELINEFHARKNKIKKLILISADRDFEEICLEALKLGIEVEIFNNVSRNSWFNNNKYKFTQISKRED